MMNVLLTLTAVILLLTASLVLLAQARLRGIVSNILGLSIIAWTIVVLLTLVLSELHLVNRTAFLMGFAIIAGALVPFRIIPLRQLLMAESNRGKNLLIVGRNVDWELGLLGIAVTIFMLLGAYLILKVPPNTNDSYLYHLSRVAHWLQNATLRHFFVLDQVKLIHPINIEIGFLWLTALWGADTLTGFIQWITTLLTMVAIYGITQQLRFSRSAGLFAAFIWSTFAIVVAQSTSTKNDLMVAFFIMAGFYFFLAGLRSHQSKYRANLALSGLALGLATGTKSLAFLALPGLGLMAAWLLFSNSKEWATRIIFWGVWCSLGFILLGSYNYVLNWLHYGSPFGPADIGDYHTVQGPTLASWVSILGRFIYQLADPTGLPAPMVEFIQQWRPLVGQKLFGLLHINPNLPGTSWGDATFRFDDGRQIVARDGVSWYGPLVFLLLLPLTLYYLIIAPFIEKNKWRWFTSLFSVSYIATFSLLFRWQPYSGRHLMIGVVLAAPLMAGFYQASSKLKLLRWIVFFVAIWGLGWSSTHNYHRPLLGSPDIYSLDYYDLRAIEKPYMALAYRYLDTHLPETASLGISGDWLITNWDYLFFGPNLKRRVIHIDVSPQDNAANIFTQYNIDYLLISDNILETANFKVPHWPVIANDKAKWFLIKRDEAELFDGPNTSPQLFEEYFGSDYQTYLEIKDVLNRTGQPLQVLTTDPKMPYYEQDKRWIFDATPNFEDLSHYSHLVIAPWWSTEDYERIGLSASELQTFLAQEEFVKKILEINDYEVFQIQF